MPRAAKPFLFDQDFAGPKPPAASPLSRRQEAELAKRDAEAFAHGEAHGRAAAADEDAARMAAALVRLEDALAGELSRTEQRAAAVEADAVTLAMALADRLAGAALARFPTADIEALAAQCFAEARTAPHVVVRVGEALVEAVQDRLGAIAAERGFAGRLVVLGDPDMPAGDARLEWADGGVVRERAAIAAAIDRALAAHLTRFE